MSNEFISLLANLNATGIENSTKETSATLVANAPVQNTKTVFTAANLWNIQGMRKSRTSRRFI